MTDGGVGVGSVPPARDPRHETGAVIGLPVEHVRRGRGEAVPRGSSTREWMNASTPGPWHITTTPPRAAPVAGAST